jgi:hypothetical protein
MTVRSFVSFDADFSTEPTQRNGEEYPPGRDLTEYLAKELNERGFPNSGVKEHDAYGWYFEVTFGESIIWCMLQLSDNWLIITKPLIPFFKRIFGKSADSEHQQVCEAIQSVIQNNSKFRNIRWFTRDEFQSHTAGAKHP